jgi:hypothetical protein
LQSELPDFSSNTIIDGSTQPGFKFGLSDAKVEIIAMYFAGLTQEIINIKNCDHIGIYGLKLNNKIFWTAQYPDNYAIFIDNSTNIEIGNIGRGNVIVNWEHAIRVYNTAGDAFNNDIHSKNINIYSNFIGINEDGVTPEYVGAAIVIWKVESVNIGGVDPALGNIIVAAGQKIDVTRTYGGNILVANNKIGTNYDGTLDLSLPQGGSPFDNIYIAGMESYNFGGDFNTSVQVINNQVVGYCRSGVFLRGMGKKFVIQGNKFGTDITGTIRLTQGMDFGVRVDYGYEGIIGYENDESQKNIIAFAQRVSGTEIGLAGCGIAIVDSKNVTISKNSIFCNQQKGIGFWRNEAIPIAAVNKITSNVYQGTAPSNAKIEVFEDDNCPNCEGKTYLTAVTADNNGNWSYNNSDLKKLVFTATTPEGETSEFSAPLYTTMEGFKTKPATCGLNNGSITGVKIISGTYWKWVDENGNIVSTDTSLTQGTWEIPVNCWY